YLIACALAMVVIRGDVTDHQVRRVYPHSTARKAQAALPGVNVITARLRHQPDRLGGSCRLGLRGGNHSLERLHRPAFVLCEAGILDSSVLDEESSGGAIR